MGKIARYTRRGLLVAGGVIGGGLLIGISVPPNRLADKADPKDLNTWLKITPDNRVTVLVPHCDIGQGAHTALAMMLAEELDADWSQVTIQEAPPLREYANEYLIRGFLLGGSLPHGILPASVDAATFALSEFMGLQITGGSASVRFTGEYGMRIAGAGARAMLIQAAAARWRVPEASLTTAAGRVAHAATNRSLTYGELASEAAQLSPPETPPLKPWTAWKLVGTSPPRIDIPAKTNGGAKYGIDTVLPGMLYATVSACPVFGGTLVSVETTGVATRPGIKHIVTMPGAIAVVADGYWRALQALRALQPVWNDAGHGHSDSAAIAAQQNQLLDTKSGSTDISRGDAKVALASAARTISATYTVPYLAHATMEPPNATVRIAGGKCDIWTGVQDPLNARATAAKAAGMNLADVTLHNCPVGGGFGRKLPSFFDFIEQAVIVAKAAAPAPVKLIWSREEDIGHDFYRTAATVRFQAGFDANAKPLALQSHYTATAGENAAGIPYQIENLHIAGSDFSNHVRTGPWRSVDHSQHGFFTESFIDELAAEAKTDPFTFRRDLLPPGRHRAVLELVAEKSGWFTPLPPNTGRGIALIEAFGSIVAEVADVTVSPDGAVRVLRVTAAIDCGDLVHPDTATAQVEGGIMFGLAAALYGEITIENGRVKQDNFDTYQVARMADTPAIDVHFIASHAPRGGIGEVGVPAAAPALCNAIHAATGVRIRALPVRSVKLPAQRAASAALGRKSVHF
jgi:isoquinoline 1-oxidoreductase beta subunit